MAPERALANRLAIGAVMLAVALQLLGLAPALIGQAIKWVAAWRSPAR